MEKHDNSHFSLDDDDEIVEEEFTERDEEYDDGYEDEEEEYDDEEDYDDYDDDYQDEGDYDDGYNDDYYDDRLNKVLDEIAEIKRGMVPSNNSAMPIPQVLPPQYIYQPTAPPAGSEVVMYNEISRLRDELAKNQSSLEMQKELTRIKEDMARDQKFAESQYNAEIKRLQDKIEDLLKNGLGPQDELPAPQEETAHLKGTETLDFGKLLSINEAVLRTTKESDSRIRGDIEQIKKQLGSFPSTEDLNRVFSAVNNASTVSGEVNNEAVSALSSEIASLRALLNSKGDNSDPAAAVTVGHDSVIDASELLRQLYDIKNIIGSSSEETVKRTQALYELVSEYKKLNAAINSQTVPFKDKLATVYSYAKKLADSNNSDAEDLVNATVAAVSELAATPLTRSVFSDLVSYCSENGLPLITQAMRDSAERYFGLNEKIVTASLDELGKYLPDFIAEKNKLENNKNESANSALLNKITAALVEETRDSAAINKLVAELSQLYVKNVVDLPTVDIPKAQDTEAEHGESIFVKLNEIRSALSELSEIKSAISEVNKAELSEIKTAISEIKERAAAPTASEEHTKEAAESSVSTEKTSDSDDSSSHISSIDLDVVVNDINASVERATEKVLAAVNELKGALSNNGSNGNDHIATESAAVAEPVVVSDNEISQALEEIRSNYLDVSEKLIDISAKLVSDEKVEVEQTLTEEDKQKILADLAYIHTKLDEYETFVNQIGELRSDILGVSSAIDLTEQFNGVLNEIANQFEANLSETTSQFDKLYEDISNVLIESEANIINRIGEPTLITDAIDAAKTELLADTQAIKDSLYVVSDAVSASPVADAVEQLRNDLQALSDAAIANFDVSTSEHQKLLEDVAFLREQAEYAIADNETAVSGSGEKLYGYLDDISAQVNALANNSQDLSATKDSVNTILDNTVALLNAVAPVTDSVSALNDTIAGITADVSETLGIVRPIADDVATARDAANAVLDAIAPVTDSVSALNDTISGITADVSETLGIVRPIADDVATARDAANAVLDALAPITDQINAILDKLDADVVTEDSEADVQSESDYIDELADIRDGLNTVLDTFPLMPQSDDVIIARDNTYSILDALTSMPHTDDMVTTRDNVAAILDAVQALTESVAAMSDSQGDGALTEDISALRDNTNELLTVVRPLGQVGEDVAALRDTVDSRLATAEETANSVLTDVQYIKQKLDETPSAEEGEVTDTLVNIMEDIGLVLDKLEAFEQSAVVDKQEIIDAVSGIREEVHISELNDTITAAGIDDETRDSLVTEIAEIRERLSNIDDVTQATNDATAVALDNIAAQLADLQNAVSSQTLTDDDTAGGRSVSQVLDEINAKLEAISNGAAVGDGDSSISDSVEVIKDYILNNPSSLDALAADIADIKAHLESGAVSALSDENVQALIDELAVIKEKIDADADYDTVAEILSLRDDVKAARIVDQNDVSGELESIKNELAVISSGNILDEIRALREEVAAIAGGAIASDSGLSAPTDGELNLVLNEIVSLRDEMFAFKDEVLSATSVANGEQDSEVETTDTDDEINIILDEITALRADQSVLTGNIDELKDIVSRRTSIASGDADAEENIARSNELNVVLDEIINLKNDLERIESNTADDKLDILSEQVEQLRTAFEELHTSSDTEQDVSSDIADIKEALDNVAISNTAVDLTDVMTQLDNINAAINELRLYQNTGDISESTVSEVSDNTVYADIRADIDDIKAAIAEIAAPQDFSTEISELRAEIDQLRAENEQLRQENADNISNQLAELREAVRDMALASAPVQTSDGDTSYAALIDEIRNLKEQVAAKDRSATIGEEILQEIRDALSMQVETPTLADAVNEIRDELAALRQNAVSAPISTTEENAEVAAMRNELAELKEMFAANPDSLFGLAEDVTSIKADVQTLKEEPDLGVINEILALRDEFQNLREQIEDVKRIAGQTDQKSDETILSEVQSLRDQLFAISMANVSDSTSGETNYESYNNIILDELASLRDQVDAVGTSDGILAVADDLAQLKASFDQRAEQYDELASRVAQLDRGTTDKKILDELSDLRTELANQRDADLTTLNFMSEMAHLLERQNQYLSQNSESKISDEIESLKAELASTDSVAEEVAKLREIMTQTGNAADNETILNELADLREELSNEKPSRENELILQEIARLRDEITVLADREQRFDASIPHDAELSDSLSDLKTQLNEIAGIIEPESKPDNKPANKATRSSAKSSKSSGSKSGAKSSTKSGSKSGAKSGAKSGSKSSSSSTNKSSTSKGTGAKRGRKPAQNHTSTATRDISEITAVIEEPVPKFTSVTTDFDAKIDEQMHMFGGDDELSLNPLDVTTTTTGDIMDMADKLAQQVANKLVMEQLVEQLGDGGVSAERVDEILREILPQEFTTIAMTEQSDKVRHLANQLVLNKLRDRLRGKNDDND